MTAAPEVAPTTTPNETPRVAESLAGLLEPVDSLTYLPGNPRRGDVGAIARSLATFGQRKPVVARRSDRAVIAGNHTLEAARTLGWSELAVVWVDDDETTAKAYALADNRTAELGTYDEPALAALIREVEAADADLLAATAWRGEDLAGLLARVDGPPVVLTDPDDVPEVPVESVTQAGDLWLLGEHRLLCGDAREVSDLEVLLGGESPSVLVTDPPYGVAIGDKNAMLNAHGRGARHEGPLDGDQGMDDAEALWRAAFATIRAQLTPGTSYYMFGPQGGGLGELLLLLREAGLEARHILVWVKDRPTFSLGRLDYEYQHEPICYGWTLGAAHRWHAPSPQSSIIQVDRPAASKLHPTMKPVAVYERLITNSTTLNATVLDPFAGSGTVVAACHETGRVARALELDPHYCDVICARYEALTGTVPVLERTGEAHAFT